MQTGDSNVSGYKAITLISLCGLLGLVVGVTIANWNFVDRDVLRGARVLFGLFGTLIGGFGGKWLFTRRQETI